MGFVKLSQDRAVFVLGQELHTLGGGFLFNEFLYDAFHHSQIHEPGVFAVIRFLAEEALIDRAKEWQLQKCGVEVSEPQADQVAEGVDAERKKGYAKEKSHEEPEHPQSADPNKQEGKYQDGNGKKVHFDGQLGKAAGIEIVGAKRRRAYVEHQPFARHAQILAHVGEQAAL